MGTDLKTDYQSFLASSTEPPKGLDQLVNSSIQRAFHPPMAWILTMAAAIYLASGIGVLLICPQLGLTLASKGGVMLLFMFLGTYGCMAACGALFLGTGALFTSLLLKPEELLRIRHHRWVLFPTFGLVALAIVIGFGAETLLGLAIAWWIGTWLGESAGFEFGWRLRNLTYATLLIDSPAKLQ